MSRILDVASIPTGAGAAGMDGMDVDDWAPIRFLPAFIAHLSFLEVSGELPCDDSAERHERSLTLFVCQQIPEAVDPRRLDAGAARGGAMMIVAARGIGLLLGPFLV